MPPLHFEDVAHHLATDQHGVVTRRQLLHGGVHPDSIDHRLRRGRLRRLHRRVYLAGPVVPPLTPFMAACLACGDAAALSHRSAGVLWDLLESPGREDPVDISLPRGRRCRPGIRIHRHGTLRPDEVTRHRRIPVTTPIRTLVDLAAVLRPGRLERAAAEAVARGLVTVEDLGGAARSFAGRPGVGRLRAVSGGGGPALTRSEAEARFLDLVRRARVEVPESNVVVAGHELDFYWPRHRLAVEVDGRAFHMSTRAFERDRRRDAELAAAGIRVVRITWRQLTREPEALLLRLGGALAAPWRGAAGPP